MNNKQSTDKNADFSKQGIKFDSKKARWDLLPMAQISRVVLAANEFLPGGSLHKLNLLDKKKEAIIYNTIMSLMRNWSTGHRFIPGTNCENLAVIAFLICFLLKKEDYITEDLLSYSSDIERWDLIDPDVLNILADVYAHGAIKYDDDNWMLVDPKRYHGAFYRHFKCMRTKYIYDSESGFLHLYQALWNVISLMWWGQTPTAKAVGL